MLVYSLVSHKHKTKRLNGDALIYQSKVRKPEQLGSSVL
jgi:hypothetical protein